jgi:integrase
MILVAYRHGLRASEVCDLQWQQIELSEGRLHVHRVKKVLLISVNGVICVIIGSISIQRSIYQSTIFGSSVCPRAPSNADLFRINEMRIAFAPCFLSSLMANR